jgi:hypothetical protein
MDSKNTLDYLLQRLKIDPTSTVEVISYTVQNFTRDDLAVSFAELGFKIGAELGVDAGTFSSALVIANPGLQLYAIDPWKEDDFSGVQYKLDVRAKVALANSIKHGFKVIRKTSEEASRDFADSSLDFVYIDGNHFFDYIMMDLIKWTPKIKAGGIIAGHDYFKYPWKHSRHFRVIEAVKAYTEAHGIKPWFVFGQDPSRKGYEKCPLSFMWVKS